MLTILATVCLGFAALYAGVTLVNLAVLHPPPPPGPQAPAQVSVLVPARNEAANIADLLGSILASTGVDLDVVVLDDGSTDATAALVRDAAARDPRVRLVAGADLPPGWVGKQHACWLLSHAARHPLMVFVDADVRLAPDALARIAGFMDRRRLDLASGFPSQTTLTLTEKLVIPQILVLLLGYLPIPFARLFGAPGFAVGCGQLMAVRREAYVAADGHRGIRRSMHDGLKLPRAVRAAGGRTDIFDATTLATCRMYDSWDAIWTGFRKNAGEGMATPVALPVWTLLLGGGHILPFLLAPLAALLGDAVALERSLWAVALVWTARALVAARVRQTPLSVLLHPIGMAIVLAIQWSALAGARRHHPATWRGRTYDV